MVAACRGVLVAVTISTAASACSERATLTIDRPGTHTLDADVIGSGPSVVAIAANDVILDLNGKTIRCRSAGAPSPAIGVSAQQRSAVTIRNGTITGCRFGISANRSTGFVVEDVDLGGNSYVGAELAFGQRNVVRRSKFASITGHTAGVYAFGINGIGSDGLIEFNTISEIYRQPGASGVGEGVGIVVEEGALRVVVRDNMLTNKSCRPNTIGVWSAIGAETEVLRNTFVNFQHGAQGANMSIVGNTFTATAPFAESVAMLANTGRASGNTVQGYEKAFGGGIADAGGNTTSDRPAATVPCP